MPPQTPTFAGAGGGTSLQDASDSGNNPEGLRPDGLSAPPDAEGGGGGGDGDPVGAGRGQTVGGAAWFSQSAPEPGFSARPGRSPLCYYSALN